MPVTSEQMDELIRQMKIANQIRLAELMHEFKMHPIQCCAAIFKGGKNNA